MKSIATKTLMNIVKLWPLDLLILLEGEYEDIDSQLLEAPLIQELIQLCQGDHSIIKPSSSISSSSSSSSSLLPSTSIKETKEIESSPSSSSIPIKSTTIEKQQSPSLPPPLPVTVARSPPITSSYNQYDDLPIKPTPVTLSPPIQVQKKIEFEYSESSLPIENNNSLPIPPSRTRSSSSTSSSSLSRIKPSSPLQPPRTPTSETIYSQSLPLKENNVNSNNNNSNITISLDDSLFEIFTSSLQLEETHMTTLFSPIKTNSSTQKLEYKIELLDGCDEDLIAIDRELFQQSKEQSQTNRKQNNNPQNGNNNQLNYLKLFDNLQNNKQDDELFGCFKDSLDEINIEELNNITSFISQER